MAGARELRINVSELGLSASFYTVLLGGEFRAVDEATMVCHHHGVDIVLHQPPPDTGTKRLTQNKTGLVLSCRNIDERIAKLAKHNILCTKTGPDRMQVIDPDNQSIEIRER